MLVLLVIADPLEDSFSHLLARRAEEGLQAGGHEIAGGEEEGEELPPEAAGPNDPPPPSKTN